MDILGGNPIMTAFLLLNVFLLGVAIAAAFMHWRQHLGPKQTVSANSSNLPDRVQEKILVQAQDSYEKIIRQAAASFGQELAATNSHLSKQLDALTTDLVRKEIDRYKATMMKLQDEALDQYGATGKEIQAHRVKLESKLSDRLMAMDTVVTKQQEVAEKKLIEHISNLKRDVEAIQSDYTKKQAGLEAELAQKQTALIHDIKQREAAIAGRQASLEQDLVGRQQQFLAKQAELEQRLESELVKRREQYQAAIDTKLSDAVVAFLGDTLGQQVDLGAQAPYLLQQLEAHKEELKQELAS